VGEIRPKLNKDKRDLNRGLQGLAPADDVTLLHHINDETLMHDHHDPAPRKFSLAQQGVGVRVMIALGLVVLVWLAIMPLVMG